MDGSEALVRIGSFTPRLTSAGLMGDVEVSSDGGRIILTSMVARRGLMLARVIGQWSLAALGVVGAFFAPQFLFLVPAALGYSFVLYLVMAWTAPTRTVTIGPRAVTEASMGWAWRLQDVFWLGSILGVLAVSDDATRTVSFVAFDRQQARLLDYVLIADRQQDAVALAHLLPIED